MLIKNKNNSPCSIDGCKSTNIARSKDWICGYHLQMEYNNKSIRGRKNWNSGNKKPIRRFSKKREIENKIYSRTRKEFLSLPENRICPVFKDKLATEIHHLKGRIGILLLNTEFWIGVSSEGHKFIHENDSWSRENGFLLSRIK